MIIIGSKVICSVSIVCFHFLSTVTLPAKVKAIGAQKLYIEFEVDNKTCNDGSNKTYKILVNQTDCIEDGN